MHDSIARFNDYLKLKNCTSGSIYRYNRDLKAFLAHWGTDDPLRLDSDHVRNYILHLLNEEMAAPSTCKNVLAALRTFFKAGLGRPEVVDGIPWPRVPWTLPDIWSSHELSILFASVTDLRFRTLLLTSYATGMRISETCHLCVTDIDRARGVIHVHLGKGSKDRFTPLSPRLLEHLEAYWRSTRPPLPYLFPGERSGKPMANKRAEAVMAEAVRRCGVNKPATPHTLRHCFATHALENGMDLHTLQRILGHASIRTTQRYIHISTLHISKAKSPFDLLDLPTASEVRP